MGEVILGKANEKRKAVAGWRMAVSDSRRGKGGRIQLCKLCDSGLGILREAGVQKTAYLLGCSGGGSHENTLWFIVCMGNVSKNVLSANSRCHF